MCLHVPAWPKCITLQHVMAQYNGRRFRSVSIKRPKVIELLYPNTTQYDVRRHYFCLVVRPPVHV